MTHWSERLNPMPKLYKVSPYDFRGFRDKGEEGSEEANDKILLQLRDELIVAGRTSVEIRLEGARVRYSNRNPLCGLRDFHFAGGGGEMIFAASDEGAFIATPSIFYGFDDTHRGYHQYAHQTYIPGVKIKTVGAGSMTVTLDAAEDPNEVEPGAYMIGGYDHQAGFSPNLMRFEYNEVLDVDVGAGVVELAAPTRNRYSADWPERVIDVNSTVGATRLFKLEGRGTPRTFNDVTRYARISDVTFTSVLPDWSDGL